MNEVATSHFTRPFSDCRERISPDCRAFFVVVSLRIDPTNRVIPRRGRPSLFRFPAPPIHLHNQLRISPDLPGLMPAVSIAFHPTFRRQMSAECFVFPPTGPNRRHPGLASHFIRPEQPSKASTSPPRLCDKLFHSPGAIAYGPTGLRLWPDLGRIRPDFKRI